MDNTEGDDNKYLEQIAEQMFRLTCMFWSLRHKKRVDDPYDFTEPEFATLDTLVQCGLCTVGKLQKALDVQPAQMSRIIRSLESKGDKPLVECQLNPEDKRKINVSITRPGQTAHKEYHARRLKANKEIVAGLSEDEQKELAKLLNRFGQIMSAQIGG